MARITSKQAQELMNAYANVYNNKEEPVQEIVEETIQEDVEQLNELGGLGTGGLMRMKNSAAPQAAPQKSFGQSQIDKAKMRGNPRLQAQARMNSGTPVNQLFNKGGNAGNAGSGGSAASTGAQQRPGIASRVANSAAGAAAGGAVGGPVGAAVGGAVGGKRIGGAIRGGLNKLGNLAGRAVGAVKQGVNKLSNAAGNVKAAVTGGIKGGVQGAQDAVKDRNRAPGAARQASVRSAQSDTTSPAAKSGLSAEMRARAAEKHAQFQKNRGKSGGRPNVGNKVTSVMDMEDYNPMEDLFDDTVNFLVSEGHVANEEEALLVMSEQEFIESFNEGFQQVLNEEA